MFNIIFVGTTVPTKIVGTPDGGILLAVPTNLSEQTTIYNSAPRIQDIKWHGLSAFVLAGARERPYVSYVIDQFQKLDGVQFQSVQCTCPRRP